MLSPAGKFAQQGNGVFPLCQVLVHYPALIIEGMGLKKDLTAE